MEGTNIMLQSTVINPNTVHVEPNTKFLKHGKQQEADRAFIGAHRRGWANATSNVKAVHRSDRDVIATLLTSQGDYPGSGITKLLDEDINYRDLGSLTYVDLELMGFKHRKQREELLDFFLQLPNQDPSYRDICQLSEAQYYNEQILQNTASHLSAMRSSLAILNYKLELVPPEDIVVGEKSFASKFTVEALRELGNVSKGIDDELKQIEKLCGTRKADDIKNKKFSFGHLVCWLSTLTVGFVFALYVWKNKKLT